MVCDVNDAVGFQCNAIRFVCYAMRYLNEGLNDIVCYAMVCYVHERKRLHTEEFQTFQKKM